MPNISGRPLLINRHSLNMFSSVFAVLAEKDAKKDTEIAESVLKGDVEQAKAIAANYLSTEDFSEIIKKVDKNVREYCDKAGIDFDELWSEAGEKIDS